MDQVFFKRLIMSLVLPSLFACSKMSSDPSSSPATGSGGNSTQNTGSTTPSSPSPTTPVPPTSGTTPPSSPGGTDTTCQPAVVGKIDAGTLTINAGAALTKNTQVQLSLDHAFVSQMKISNTADCSCGNWEPYLSSKTWNLSLSNAINTISVQFKDYDSVPTKCVSASILHDNTPPQINLTAATGNSYLYGSTPLFNYSVTDAGAGVKSVTCAIDDQAISCNSPTGTLSLTSLASGSHKISVKASDNLDQENTGSQSFTISTPYHDITQNKVITADNKVDILVVVDNSPSMQDIQKSMAKRVSSLMDQVKNLDYRIAVTTTDPSNATTGDGRLLPLTGFGNQYVISPDMGLVNAQAALANTVQRPEIGSITEEGIYATYRVIERALAGETNAKNFFRSDAAFATILISDADESANGSKNKPENLISLVKTNWPSKKFIFNSLIVRPGDSACLNSGRENYGPTYDSLSRLLGYGTVGGSIIGTVCASDYGSQLSGIGQSVQQLVKIMDLDCAPIGSATSAVTVVKDGSHYTDAYTIQGLKIIFQNNLPVGNYTLTYQCQ